jgi:hypothetical protein
VKFAPCAGRLACGGLVTAGGPYLMRSPSKAAASSSRARLYSTVWSGARAKNGKARTAFTFKVPVPKPGEYRVRLHFIEPGFTSTGRRLFDVNVEGGKAELSRFDIFRAARARNRPVTRTIRATVTDGVATIAFVSRRDRAVLSALEVLPG